MTEYEMIRQYGWICPRCGQSNAPWMCFCTCQNRPDVTYSDRTDYKAETKDEYVTLHHDDIHFINEDAEREFYESLAKRKEE